MQNSHANNPQTTHDSRGISAEGVEGFRDAPKLTRIDDVLYLCAGDMRISCDFTKLLPRISPRALFREPLVATAKRKGGCAGGFAVDATAGLGEDGLLLAAAGYDVALIEHNPLIVDLLKDGIRRAQEHPLLAETVSRMHVLSGDATEILRAIPSEISQGCRPDVVYLDPMFPTRQKSAAVKKKFQLLHLIEAPNRNDEELLAAAFDTQPKKIIVKRPPKGPYFADKKPSYAITHKAVRFDVYVP